MKLPDPFEPWHEHLTVALAGAQVVFTTRRGGFSGGPFESLNLGRLTQDRPEDVERNRRRVEELVGRRLAMARQVHGTTIHTAERTWPQVIGAGQVALPEGDGILTAHDGLAPAVLVADCLPVALSCAGSVAMLHAGWRGLAAGILEQGVRAIRGRDAQAEVQAAIGPGVGVCCYEVGEEVHRTFSSYGPEVRRGRNLNLRAAARAQLTRAEVAVIHDLPLCTSCSPELFFSHRRDQGITGRQGGIVWSS